MDQSQTFLPNFDGVGRLNDIVWDTLKFTQVSEDGRVERGQVDCTNKWQTKGPIHCWSKGIASRMNKGLDCYLADCEQITFGFMEILPIVKIAISALPMAVKLVRKVYSNFINDERRKRRKQIGMLS